ncbi:MAG: NAD(P)-dependent oxidoreductase [Cytophaga sp.]|nr:NAD(P)-dependent oxidoreductase [Undibacterium sp.]
MSQILIVGANSALARDAMPILSQRHKIITAGRSGCDIICDITKDIVIPEGTDVVINFAAGFAGTNDDEFLNTFKTNTLGILAICAAANQANVGYVVNISSVFAELIPEHPQYTIYALSKKQADELASYFCLLRNLPLLTLRPSQIYGDTMAYAKHQPFLYEIIDRAAHGRDITVFGEHDPQRNYIHSADLATIISLAVDARLEGTYSCLYPENIGIAEIGKIAEGIFGKGSTIAFDPTKPNTPDTVFSINTELFEALGYYPRISMETGITQIKTYMEAHV